MTLRPGGRLMLVIGGSALVVALAGTGVAGMRGWVVRAPAAAGAPAGCVSANKAMTLYVEQLPDDRDGRIRLGYGLTPKTASIPGPLVELVEGDCIAITVVNDVPARTLAALRDRSGGGHHLPLGISLHVHGVKYTADSDGTVHSGSFVPPGQARTYTWYAAPRVTVGQRVVSLGTAGYWWYHDHVVGTDHGTAGVDAGLFGGVVVRRPGDLKPVRTHTVVMGDRTSLNLRRYPATDTCRPNLPVAGPTCFVARRGERTEFLVIGIGNEFHTFHLHGHNWADNRTGMLVSQADETALIDNKTVGPADSFGFQVIAGEEVGNGAWMMHCHVQKHSDTGMMTFFRVIEPDGTMAPATPMTDLVPHQH